MHPILESIISLVILCNLLIGSWVLLKNPRHILNISFFIFVCGISIWSLGVLLLYRTHNFYFSTLASIGGLITFGGATLFAYVFPSKKSIPLHYFIFLLPICLALCVTPLHVFIERIIVYPNGDIELVNGPLFFVYVLIGITYFVCAPVYFFIQNYEHATPKEKTQMKYLALGISVFILCSITFDVLLTFIHINELSAIGPASSLIFIGLTSYAIVRHQLMDIKVIIQRGLIYTILFSLIAITYICLLFLSESFFDSSEEISTPLYAVLIIIIGILTLPHIETYFRRITDPIFFKDQYDYGESLEELSKILNDQKTSSEMTPILVTKLCEIFRTKDIHFEQTSCDIAAPETCNASSGINACVSIRNKPMGSFIVGDKLSGNPYSSKDKQLLRTFAELASIAFEKAELFETIKEYSKSLEEKIYARTKEIKELNENQRKLFDDISHELQTPLTVLKGSIESIKAESSLKSNSFNPIEQSIDRLSKLIREILTLARIDGINTSDSYRPILLSTLVRDTIEYIEVVCKRNNIEIMSNITPDIYVTGDEKQLEEILINILSNSINYTSMCNVKKIFVGLYREDKLARLVIRDTGIGITPEYLPHIFERFYRAHEKDSKGQPGNGLGLAIVKRLVEKHQGDIFTTSTLGVGTEMTILFPSIPKPKT